MVKSMKRNPGAVENMLKLNGERQHVQVGYLHVDHSLTLTHALTLANAHTKATTQSAQIHTHSLSHVSLSLTSLSLRFAPSLLASTPRQDILAAVRSELTKQNSFDTLVGSVRAELDARASVTQAVEDAATARSRVGEVG